MPKLYFPGRDKESYFLSDGESVVLRGESMTDLVDKIRACQHRGLFPNAHFGTKPAFNFEPIREERDALDCNDLSNFWERYHNTKL